MEADKKVDPTENALQEVLARQKIRAGQSPEEIVAGYDNWPTYDEIFENLNFRGHKVIGDTVVKYLSDNKDVQVLDVAAGSGVCGVELKAHGFTNVDGLDPSEGMLNAARQKDAYRNYIKEYFPSDNTSLKTSSYDVLVTSGGLAEGMMGCDCLPEMVRCVKTGGFILISLKEAYLTTVAEYKDRFEPLMKQLEKDGQLKILERTVFPKVWHTYDGLLFVLQVTKPDQ